MTSHDCHCNPPWRPTKTTLQQPTPVSCERGPADAAFAVLVCGQASGLREVVWAIAAYGSMSVLQHLTVQCERHLTGKRPHCREDWPISECVGNVMSPRAIPLSSRQRRISGIETRINRDICSFTRLGARHNKAPPDTGRGYAKALYSDASSAVSPSHSRSFWITPSGVNASG